MQDETIREAALVLIATEFEQPSFSNRLSEIQHRLHWCSE
jgi:hypothetical protein